MERVVWEMVLSLSTGGHARGGVYRDLGIHHKEAEHGGAVHCDATSSGVNLTLSANQPVHPCALDKGSAHAYTKNCARIHR